MANSNYQLAEMVNSANYAAMSYNELVTIDMAFHLAILEVTPLIEKKRTEEIAAHTHEYVAIMNNYGTSKAEILDCLEREVLRETPYDPFTPQDVDDQAQETVPGEDSWKEQAHKETILLLPEHVESMVDVAQDQVMTVSADVEEQPAEEAPESNEAVSMETNNVTFVEEAMGIMRTLTIPENVNPNEPYYMECDFSYEGELGHSDPSGRNMRRKDLEEFRSASEVYYRVFKKKNVIASTNDCLAYNDSLNTITVRLYHFPEDAGNTADTPVQEAALTVDETKKQKKKQSYLRKAIKLAKENAYSDGTDVDRPFYDKYMFRPGMKRSIELKRERERHYEDAADLTELMPAFESYARLFHEGYTVLAKDNCVAAMMYETIYVVLFNIPTQEKKRGRVSKELTPMAKDVSAPKESEVVTDSSTNQSERDFILNADEMTKTLPVEIVATTNAAETSSIINHGAEDNEETKKELVKNRRLIKKAMKAAKEEAMTDETNSPFLMMVSYLVGSNHISKTSTFPKIYEDAALLAKRKLDFEKKIGLMPGNPLVINKENCLAVMKDPLSFGSKSIDVVYLHVPNNKDAKNLTYENEHDNKSNADSYTNYLIEKAVERTKILEINGGTDVKAPYYIQQDYIIPQEKELLTNGASFCFHFSLDSLDKYKALHRKYARAMKATQILSADDYTAFIWNGGKNVCVYYYNVRDTESLK